MTFKREPIEYTTTPEGCWICTNKKRRTKDGYSRMKKDGKIRLVHRWMYEQKFGPIPKGMECCHKCDNPQCINPDHLFLGTHKENMVDMGKKGRANYKKLTEEQVIAIRNDTTTFQRTLAKQYGVAQPTICRIKSGKLFQRLPKTKNHLQFETK